MFKIGAKIKGRDIGSGGEFTGIIECGTIYNFTIRRDDGKPGAGHILHDYPSEGHSNNGWRVRDFTKTNQYEIELLQATSWKERFSK
jgi:hypothetical protein